MHGPQTRSTAALLAVALLALLISTRCGRGDERLPDIVLLTLDTTRIDRIGCYGGVAANTPNVDAIAAEGNRFASALCQAPITAPSHASMLTGQYPRQHGVYRNQDGLPTSPPMLPEFLKESGYATAAFTSVRLLTPETGFARGFDHFDPPEDGRSRPARETVTKAIGWIEAQRAETPLFLWVHLFDAHFPYHWDPEEEGAPGLPPYDGPIQRGDWEEIEEAAGAGGIRPVDRERLLELYTAKVELSDYWVGRLEAALRGEGRWERTELFLLSDHGEGFEHGVFLEHANSLYKQVSQVALIWKRAGGKGAPAVVESPVETIDIVPTVAELLGRPAPPGAGGVSLFRAIDRSGSGRRYALAEEPSLPPRAAARVPVRNALLFGPDSIQSFPEPRTDGERIAVTDGVWKYIFDTGRGDELYQIDEDPEESRNRIESAPPGIVEGLQEHLLEWRRAHPWTESTPAGEIDSETRALLESLGYL